MRRDARWRLLLPLLVLAWLAPTGATAQDFVPVRGKEPIPREPYKTWSLFLVTNQDWLLSENAARVRQLYWRAQAFGRVIGQDHLAVWFWKKDAPLMSPELADNVDVERAIAYCQKLGLRPSAGPYLLFTTTYPDEDVTPEQYKWIELGTSSSDRIGELLNQLGDQLVRDGLIRERAFTKPAGSDDFWRAWFDATARTLARLGLAFPFTIRTPTLTLVSGPGR